MKTFEKFREDNWYPIRDEQELEIGDFVRTPDGLVKVVQVLDQRAKFYGEIVTPIHKDVIKGETYEYDTNEVQVLAKRQNKNKVSMKSLMSIDDLDGKHFSPDIHNPIEINPTIEQIDRMIKEELKMNVDEKVNLTQTMTRGLALVLKRRVIVAGQRVRQEQKSEDKLDALSIQMSALAGLTLLSTSVSGDGILSKAAIVSGLMST